VRALGQTLVTAIFLGAIWGGVALLAWALDALPDTPAQPDAGPSDPGADTPDAFIVAAPSVDAGQPAAVGSPADLTSADGLATPDEPLDPDAPAVVPADPPPAEPVQVFALATPEPKPYIVSLAAGDLTGDERPELVVGLGERVEVLGLGEDGGLERLWVIRHRPANADTTPSSPRAAIGDATGDGVADLLIAFWRRAHSLGSRGGGAWILRGMGDGTLDRPRRFAGPRMMISSIDLLDVDGREGNEIVLSDRGRPYGDIPGRVRVYRAARRPRLLRDFSAETNDVRMVLPAHADGDELVDLVAFGEAVIRFRNTGRGRFERMEGERKGAFFANVYHGLSADLDRDGALEAYAYPRDFETAVVIVDADGFRAVPGTADPMRRVVPGDGLPARVVVAGTSTHSRWDLASFGANDRLGDRRVARQAGHLGGVAVIGTGHDAVVADLDGDGALELITLDSAWHDGQTEWQLAIGPLEGGASWTPESITGEPVSHDVR